MDNKWMYLIATALIIFFLFSFILPLFSITKHITIDSFKDVLFSKRFVQVFTNSFKVSIASMILSILIAYLAAYAINNTKIPYKNLFSAFFILPIMVPTISIGYGLVNIFGRNGAFTRLTSIDINIYGPVGIIIGTALHSFPVAYLILSNAMKLYDNSVYESAEILGLSSFKVFSKITFPFLSRPLISAAISVFLLAFTDYGIPLMVGGRYTTISIFLYREVVGLLNFSKGSSLAIILLTLAFFLFLFEVFNKSYDVSDSVYTGLIVKENKIRDIICGTILVLLILLITVLFGSFLIVSFINNFPNDWTFTLKHVNQALKRGALTALKNSIFISLLSSCCGAVIAYLAS